MKKLISLALLCSMTMGMVAGDVGTADAEKCCNSCNTCPTTTTTCNSCNSCGCKTTLTQEEEAAGVQRCACNKPKPVAKTDIGTPDAEKCCNSCNTCPTTTTTCNSCSSCGCKTTLTQEEEAAGEQRCACGKPRPGRSEVGDSADAEKCCNKPCNTCPTTTTTCNSCNSCGCKTTLTAEEEAAGEQRCACNKPKPGRANSKALAKVTVAKAMKKNQ